MFPGSDFFQHFGNGTSTGSIGKNSLNLPSIGKISDIYLKINKNGKNIMISVTVICFLKLNYIRQGCMKIPCNKYQMN